MLNRELEVTDQWVPAEILDELDATPSISKVGYAQTSEYYYLMHTKKPPLDDIHVRKALAYACDYGMMMEEIYMQGTSYLHRACPHCYQGTLKCKYIT